jgi:hypothetical protein
VLTSVSTPEEAALARDAGADDVLFYKAEPLAERVLALTGGVGVDRIIEVMRGFGITSAIPRHVSLALGTPDITLLEMAAGYAGVEEILNPAARAERGGPSVWAITAVDTDARLTAEGTDLELLISAFAHLPIRRDDLATATARATLSQYGDRSSPPASREPGPPCWDRASISGR